MRLTLEQLKAMSDDELYIHWRKGLFPFESLACGGMCLTLHRPFSWGGQCKNPTHANLIADAKSLPHMPSSNILRPCLEELYAMRLFHDALYPQAVEAAPQIEQAIAESVVHAEVVE